MLHRCDSATWLCLLKVLGCQVITRCAHELAEVKSPVSGMILIPLLRHIVLQRSGRNQVADLKILCTLKLCKLLNHVARERAGHDAMPMPIKITVAPKIVNGGGTSSNTRNASIEDPIGSASATIAT